MVPRARITLRAGPPREGGGEGGGRGEKGGHRTHHGRSNIVSIARTSFLRVAHSLAKGNRNRSRPQTDEKIMAFNEAFSAF